MTAQTHLHSVPDTHEIADAKGFVVRILADAGPRWKSRAERRADRRHRVMVMLEELHRETPWYDVRARHALHKAIVAHIGMGF